MDKQLRTDIVLAVIIVIGVGSALALTIAIYLGLIL